MSEPSPEVLRAEPAAYAAAVDAWCAAGPPALVAAARPIPDYATRVAVMSDLMGALFAAGWSRYGWPEHLGGLGGTIVHRGALWRVLAAHGLRSMAVFEHLEVLLPTLAALGPTDFVAEALPAFLAGRERWAQGFSEPDAGSDLAALRTRAVADGDEYRITGRKIWTSWARYATWCLVLARTGTTESRHRGLTAFVVDLRHPGVEVRAIDQANGTDELAEVTFDDVAVPADRIVGDLDGGWKVAMHILSHERGTYAWFRQCFMYHDLIGYVADGPAVADRAVGDALLDIAAVAATSGEGLRLHTSGATLGPRATITKLLLCEAERSIQDAVLAGNPDLALGPLDDTTALLRQEYLFSRIVTVYGGSQQMQLETIAKQLLELPVNRDAAPLAHDEFLAASRAAVAGSSGSNALDALGWWDLLGMLDDAEARAAVFALFRAHGRELGGSCALGALAAVPYLDGDGDGLRTIMAFPRISPTRGPVHVVLGDLAVDRILVDGGDETAVVVDVAAASLRPVVIPGRIAIHEVEVDPGAGEALTPGAGHAVARARSAFLARLAAAYEILGAAEGAFALAMDHAPGRVQFGQAIGTFQAVRHLLAWAVTDTRAIESVADVARDRDGSAPPRFDEIVKALAGRNGRRACERSLQVLGAIGFTAELDHHHFHSRVLTLDGVAGTSAELTTRLGAWVRAERPDPGIASAVLLA